MHNIGSDLLDLHIDYNFSFDFHSQDNEVVMVLEGEKGWEVQGAEISYVMKKISGIFQTHLGDDFDVARLQADKGEDGN